MGCYSWERRSVGLSSEIILVLGGARSGKSAFALHLADELGGSALFVATAKRVDAETNSRILEHVRQRPAGWMTVEAPVHVAGTLSEHISGRAVVVLDCLSMLVANMLLAVGTQTRGSEIAPDTAAVEARVLAEVETIISVCRQAGATLIVVSNEVGMGVVPPYPLGRAYRDLLGRANQVLAGRADRVYFMLAGLPMELKPHARSAPAVVQLREGSTE